MGRKIIINNQQLFIYDVDIKEVIAPILDFIIIYYSFFNIYVL